jgi:hypothetical protein
MEHDVNAHKRSLHKSLRKHVVRGGEGHIQLPTPTLGKRRQRRRRRGGGRKSVLSGSERSKGAQPAVGRQWESATRGVRGSGTGRQQPLRGAGHTRTPAPGLTLSTTDPPRKRAPGWDRASAPG